MIKRIGLNVSLCLALALFSLGFYSCDSIKNLHASDVSITKDVIVPEFTGIAIQGGMDVIYSSGGASMRMTGPDNVIPLINTVVNNGMLTISYDKKFNLVNTGKVTIYLSSASLSNVNLNGSGNVKISTPLSGTNSSISINGSGDIDMIGANVNAFNCSVNGSGDIKASNIIYAKNINVAINGSGDIKLNTISSTTNKLAIQGSGEIEVDKSESVDCYTSISGSGEIKIVNVNSKGIQATINGSGEIALSGTCIDAAFNINASGCINADNLHAQNAVASVGGSGSLKCNASGVLATRGSGSGEIYYKGNPIIQNSRKDAPIRNN